MKQTRAKYVLRILYPLDFMAPLPSASLVDFSFKSKFVLYRKTEIHKRITIIRKDMSQRKSKKH